VPQNSIMMTSPVVHQYAGSTRHSLESPQLEASKAYDVHEV